MHDLTFCVFCILSMTAYDVSNKFAKKREKKVQRDWSAKTRSGRLIFSESESHLLLLSLELTQKPFCFLFTCDYQLIAFSFPDG